MAQTLKDLQHILLSLIIFYPVGLPLPTFATHLQHLHTSQYQFSKADIPTHKSESTPRENQANPLKQAIMSSAMSEKSTSQSKRNSPKRSLASSSATSDAKRRKSEHIKKFTEMKLEDIEQIFQNSRNALDRAEELYQDAEKARAHQTLSSAMIRKANATKDTARLEMIKDAREAIEKRDNLQIQVEKQKKELFTVETKLLT
ncbi:hypothetical protein FOC4_g10005587 [Fusarium odoratissimum]|uniref:Uncharacterized protein n=2 Tax=Fusarium oxysporum species complex TaxID=171631 RepID=N1RNX5_FUSC4|nr:hypothetical protein FOC4_g10005587 [Fusarium odoratissimum]TXB96006.1 hypothetical protein FocTR4_00016153 [Fusarium oxysporum f. sp. cubense]